MKKLGKIPRTLALETGIAKSTILRMMQSQFIERSTLLSLKKLAISLDCKVKDLFDYKKD